MPTILSPIIKTVMADTETPISIFAKLKPFGAQFLLESAERGEQFGRYSLIALNPEGHIAITDRKLTVSGELSGVVTSTDPFAATKQALVAYRVEQVSGDFPFVGGVAGFYAYDCIRYVEELPNIPPDDMGFPDMHVYLFKQVLIYDHLKHSLTYSYLVDKTSVSAERIADISAEMDALLKRVLSSAMPAEKAATPTQYKTYANMNRETYENNVRKAREYIKEGDIFQVVLSRRRTCTPAPDAFSIYRKLRSVNPSPYMYFLDFKDYYIVGSSPECLTRLSDGVVETFPIAGTRKRGKDAAEDEALARELLADEKERAEHAMLVDLGRNDIGALSEFGTVAVKEMMHVEYFSHVMHIVSRVEGKMKSGIDGVDALKHVLPAGTVSGAPKIRAMEIIDELENTKRGPYAGAVGYFDFRGNMDVCITIRTLLFKDNCVHAQAGAGIVYDSVPEKEFEETDNKLGALFKALGEENSTMEEVEAL